MVIFCAGAGRDNITSKSTAATAKAPGAIRIFIEVFQDFRSRNDYGIARKTAIS